jgi:hypothetical protein
MRILVRSQSAPLSFEVRGRIPLRKSGRAEEQHQDHQQKHIVPPENT